MRAVLVAVSWIAALCACAGGTSVQASPITLDHNLVRNELTKGPEIHTFLCEKKSCDETDLPSLVDDKAFGAAHLGSEDLLPPYAFGRPDSPGENGWHGRRPHKPGKDEQPVHSVPEPGTLVLLSVGVGLFAARSLRSRQRA